MIEKVTLQLTGDSKLVPENGPDCGEMNPKTLLLYAAAKCSGMTALMIMEKERLRPKRFEISVSGELSTEEVRSESVFKSFHVVYNIECDTEDDQAKVSPRGDADARKILRHHAHVPHDRPGISRNRGGQHRTGESLTPQSGEKIGGSDGPSDFLFPGYCCAVIRR